MTVQVGDIVESTRSGKRYMVRHVLPSAIRVRRCDVSGHERPGHYWLTAWRVVQRPITGLSVDGVPLKLYLDGPS